MKLIHDILSISGRSRVIQASDIYYYHTNHLGSTAYVTDNNATVTQGFLYAPFGEITTEFNATFGNDVIPKYSFNAKELDEETGMYYYEARYYKPPVFTSRDPMFEKKPWLTPYHYCSNNPVGRVDPSGKFDNEAEANKYQKRATRKYGKDRVGEVYNASTNGNPNYEFQIFGQGKDRYTHPIKDGVSAFRPDVCVSDRIDLKKYNKSQSNRKFGINVSLTMGAQAGYGLGKKTTSVNIGSIDLIWFNKETGGKAQFGHVNEYGETTARSGITIGPINYQYTKEPHKDAYHSYGFGFSKNGISHTLDFSDNKRIDINIGAALIIGLNVDLSYTW